MGGTHRVKYDDTYQSGKAIPTTDADHGNEKLWVLPPTTTSDRAHRKALTGGDYT